MVKAVLAVALAAAAVFLLLTGQDLVRENKKMLKLIRNEEKLRRNFNKLRQSEAVFAQYYIPLDNKSDPEKIKAESIAGIMNIIEDNNLKVDSYRSEVEEAGEFTLFKYNITIVGGYPDVARFFSSLAREARNIFVASYTIQYHIEASVRVGLQVELVGVRSK